MKKTILFICFFTICLTACSNNAKTNDEMLAVMKEEENISADIKECGKITDDDKVLIIGVTGENDKTYCYYAAQFVLEKNGEYSFEDDISLNTIGWQIRLCDWNKGYVLMCNNEAVKQISIEVNPKGEEKQIYALSVEELPFVYYLDMSAIKTNYDIQYTFIDCNGEEIE
jgi:hypothetical protein